jgi:hypothetical protein
MHANTRHGEIRYASRNITQAQIFLMALGLNFSRSSVTGVRLEKTTGQSQCPASFPRGGAIGGKDVC